MAARLPPAARRRPGEHPRRRFLPEFDDNRRPAGGNLSVGGYRTGIRIRTGIIEQYRNNRLIRPRADYTGAPDGQKWVPIDQRQ